MNNIQLEEITPFFTKIHILKLNNFDADKIIRHVHNVKTLDSGVTISNVGGWQSSPIFSPSEDMTSIVEEIHSVLIKIYLSMGIKTEPKLIGYWMNINNKHSINKSHCHGGSYYSAVLYVRAPENCGNIVFDRDDTLPHYLYDVNLTENNYKDYWIKPTAGEVIIFPAWLNHYVEPNLTEDKDDRRISIAFNYR